ncbi:MAG: hypothetical protein RIC55_04275 [Pirellulaceae bacterium]
MGYQDYEMGSLDRFLEALYAFGEGQLSRHDLDNEIAGFGYSGPEKREYAKVLLAGMIAGAGLKDDDVLMQRLHRIVVRL